MRVTNEQIIEAYKQTGSVWKAAKILGINGQSVHERLVRLNYQLNGQQWSDEELSELHELAGHHTIAEIANKLGRPYAGVALKISRLGLSNRYGNKQINKIPKNGLYTKEKIAEYIKLLDSSKITLSKFAVQNNLNKDSLNNAIKKHFSEWFENYIRINGTGNQLVCPNCQITFWQSTKKQVFCSGTCSGQYRVNQNYFGGRRHETIGLAEKICQICKRYISQGLSSHHMIGKENDPNNEYLIALCRGCHNIVTQTAGRNFNNDAESWESLIALSLIRKYGLSDKYQYLNVSVEIEYFNED